MPADERRLGQLRQPGAVAQTVQYRALHFGQVQHHALRSQLGLHAVDHRGDVGEEQVLVDAPHQHAGLGLDLEALLIAEVLAARHKPGGGDAARPV